MKPFYMTTEMNLKDCRTKKGNIKRINSYLIQYGEQINI